MITKNFNGQNGAATSAVNVEVFYITSYGTKKVVNAFESVEERREIIEIISKAVAYGKKDFYLYYKIGDFVGCFSLDKDYKGNYVLCYGGGQVNLWFGRLSGAKNFNTLESEIYNAIREMVFKMSEQVVEQENEQDEDEEYEDVDYLVSIFNEKMVEDITNEFESSLGSIRSDGEWHTESGQICGVFSYEKDYEHEWVEFYHENGNGGINHAYDIFRNAPDFTSVDFFNEDDAEELVEELGENYGVGIEDNSWGDCLVWVKNPFYVSEVENALESAMDSGEEYYDDRICQIGEFYVSYTSPCDEFPNGCVCVVDEEGRLYGNWCNVSDSGFAVDFLVNTIEKCNKEFNSVA